MVTAAWYLPSSAGVLGVDTIHYVSLVTWGHYHKLWVLYSLSFELHLDHS